MMVRKLLLLGISWMLLCSGSTFASKYGDLEIQKGQVTVVRLGKNIVYSPENSPVEVNQQDILRVGADSSAILVTDNDSRLTLGANAVMQLKKWKKAKETGALRMLFGKFRARTIANNKREGLNILTTTAVIGVKGSLAEGVTNPNFTSVSNLGGNISMTNISTENSEIQEFPVPLGQTAFKSDNDDAGVDGVVENPRFDPEATEEESETTNVENLDAEDSKEVQPPPGVPPPKVEEVNEEEATVVADVTEGSDEEKAQEKANEPAETSEEEEETEEEEPVDFSEGTEEETTVEEVATEVQPEVEVEIPPVEDVIESINEQVETAGDEAATQGVNAKFNVQFEN